MTALMSLKEEALRHATTFQTFRQESAQLRKIKFDLSKKRYKPIMIPELKGEKGLPFYFTMSNQETWRGREDYIRWDEEVEGIK